MGSWVSFECLVGFLADACLVLAPTGASARIIDGATPDSTLGVRRAALSHTPLSATRASKLQPENARVRCVIHDEARSHNILLVTNWL